MYPVHTPEVIHAEQARRLEGFRVWSHRRGTSDAVVGVDYTPRQENGHPRPAPRPALGH